MSLGMFTKCKTYQMPEARFISKPVTSKMDRLDGDDVKGTTINEADLLSFDMYIPSELRVQEEIAQKEKDLQMFFRNPINNEFFIRSTVENAEDKFRKLSILISDQDRSPSPAQ